MEDTMLAVKADWEQKKIPAVYFMFDSVSPPLPFSFVPLVSYRIQNLVVVFQRWGSPEWYKSPLANPLARRDEGVGPRAAGFPLWS